MGAETLDQRNRRDRSAVAIMLRVVLGVSFIVVALAIGLHQHMTFGQFFQLKDALHHEFFMALMGAFGLGVLADIVLTRL